ETWLAMQARLATLSERLQDALDDAPRAIQDMLERLEAHVRECKLALAAAQEALAACEQGGQADCTNAREAVYRAQQELEEAEGALRRFEGAAQAYQDIEASGLGVVRRDIPEMLARLRRWSDLVDQLRARRGTLNEAGPATGAA